MAKIKLYIAKAQSNNSGAAKGTAENSYTVTQITWCKTVRINWLLCLNFSRCTEQAISV